MAADVSISSLSIGTGPVLRPTVRRGDGELRSAAPESGTADGSGKAAVPTDRVTLSDAAEQQLRTLRQADTTVRQHEAAHQAAGGPHAGGAAFTYTRGPDGRNYATAGEVPIDVSREADPEKTIDKMEQVKAAALAPAEPSPQDMRVAAQADAVRLQAQSEQRRTAGGPAARAAAAYGAAQALGGPGAAPGPTA